MPGMLIEATLGDAIVKDIVGGELAENIFEAMLKDGETASGVIGVGRVGLTEYRKLGYVPHTVAHESVNETLDNALGDYAIAAAAKKLSKNDIAEKYFKYSKNYANLFDKKTGFIRGKDENGNFRDEIFDPFMWGRDYTEGSAWQNAFGVYHDIKGLDALYEGKLEEKIDELMIAPREYRVGSYGFVIHEMVEMVAVNYGQCAISNQPSFHIPYIYSELGKPEKTALHMKELFKRFNSGFSGFPGDEDNGTTSAWYLLSAMGLYQMAPSRPDFATSLPLFNKMTVKLANGNVLKIDKSKYDLTKMSGSVSYFDVMRGGELSEITKNKE
jgi:predicted alpha-1,2-mannosidase